DLDHVLDADEIAPLLARGVTARAFEQRDLAGGPVLLEEVPHDRSHAPLVRLTRAVDIEVAEAGHLRRALRQHAPYVLIEQELRIAVDVERRFAGPLFAEFATGAVDGRGRRVQH